MKRRETDEVTLGEFLIGLVFALFCVALIAIAIG